MKIVKSVTLLLLVILPQSSYAAFKTYENTWFEIEVILFQQLGDKTQLQEVFPETSTLSQPESMIDLLEPHLAPTLEEAKIALPQCIHFPQFPVEITENEERLLLDQASLNQTVALSSTSDLSNVNKLIADTALQNQIDLNDTNEFSEDLQSEEKTHEKFNVNHTLIDLDGPTLLTTYETQEPVSDIFYTPETSCELVKLTVPEVIAGEENLTAETPYIINEESLKLLDIMKQLKRSRSFKPLLHTGWRQITRLKSEAIPVKLSAGDNLAADYLAALSNYNATIEEKEFKQLFEDNLNTLTENETLNGVSDSVNLSINSEAVQTPDDINSIQLETANNTSDITSKLTAIIQEAKTKTHNLDSVLAELNGAHNDSQYIASPLNADIKKALSLPQLPPQNWTIDGFLTVEVERFLHIRADFNVINMSISEQATQQLSNSDPAPLKSIHFKQNKRVRSNEIHYFDHPYMGMIVQIRRHEQTEPEPEIEKVLETAEPLMSDSITSITKSTDNQ